jgi:hypothetical protein
MNYGSVFTMSSWARIPMAIGYLALTGLILITQDAIKYPGLSFLVGTGNMIQDAQNPIYVLLSNIDIFWLWHLLLAVLGLSVVSRLSRGKSLVLILIYAVLAVAITVLPTLLFAGMAG